MLSITRASCLVTASRLRAHGDHNDMTTDGADPPLMAPHELFQRRGGYGAGAARLMAMDATTPREPCFVITTRTADTGAGRAGGAARTASLSGRDCLGAHDGHDKSRQSRRA